MCHHWFVVARPKASGLTLMPIPPLTKRLAKRDWRKKKWLKHGALSCIQHRRSADGRVKNIEFLLMKVRQREGLKWHCRSLKYDCAHGARHQTPFRNALNFPRVYKPPRNKFDSFFFFFSFSPQYVSGFFADCLPSARRKRSS